MCDCRCLGARVVVVTFVPSMVVLSQYDSLVFVGVYLCLGGSNEQRIYD